MNAKEYLLEFRKTRDFNVALPELYQNEALRNSIFDCIQSVEYPFPEYSSWLANHFFSVYPETMKKQFCDDVVQVLLTTSNHSVQRNCTTLLAISPFDLSQNGLVLNRLIDFITEKDSLPALIYQSLLLIEKKYLPTYPEIQNELHEIVATWHEHPKPSLRAMARNYEKKYHKKS